MGLTDAGLLWFIIALAVGGAATLVVQWHRLSGAGAVPVLGRIGAILGLNLLVLLAAGVVVNDQYDFFVSWSDLIGSESTTVVTTHAGGSVAQAVTADPPGPSSSQAPPQLPVAAAAGTDTQYEVTGTVSGVTAPVVVILPPGYSDPANANRRYPVVEAFPGYPGSAIGVLRHFNLAGTNDVLVASHRMAPTLFVIPTTWTPPGRDTECVNGPPGTTQTETWVAQDVPAWVQSHFRVQPGRASWATFGMSAGGWCAAMTAMLHPSRFAAAIVLGGYFRPDWGNWVPYPPGALAVRRYDLVTLARTAPPPVALWVYTSAQDTLSGPSTRALLAAARAPLSVTADVASSGGHRLSQWTPVLSPALQWLGTNVPGFAPGPA